MLASAAAVRALQRQALTRTALGGIRTMASLEAYDDYGKNVFAGKVADEYLQKQGASGDILKNPTWVKTHADVVANAVFDWYVPGDAVVHCSSDEQRTRPSLCGPEQSAVSFSAVWFFICLP